MSTRPGQATRARTADCLLGDTCALHRPGHAGEDRGGDGQFGLRLVRALCNRLVGQDDAVGVAEGAERVHGAAARLAGQAPALRFAIHGHPLQSCLPTATPCSPAAAAGTGTAGGATWALSAAERAWPSSLQNRRCNVDGQGVRPARKPSARSTSGVWRAPHAALASTASWFARIAATARVSSAGKV